MYIKEENKLKKIESEKLFVIKIVISVFVGLFLFNLMLFLVIFG